MLADKYHGGIPTDHLAKFRQQTPDPHPGVMPATHWTRFHSAWARKAGQLAELLGARMATTLWLVSTTGSNSNGGTSKAVLATGTNGIASVAGGLTKFTSISATWTSALVGQGIFASSGTILRLISAVQTAQSVATAVTVNTQTTLTSVALFNSTMLGCAVSGPGIAAGTYISVYTNSSSMTLSAAAGAGAGTGALVIGPLATTTGTTNFTAATGQTWNVGGMLLTVNRALVTASGVVNAYSAGDSIYIGAGGYRETVANAVSGSSGNVVSIIGDVDGAQTGVAGQVTITGYTTNDTTVPSSSNVLSLAATSYLNFSLITVISGGNCVAGAAGCSNFTFTDCTFNSMAGFVGGSNNALSFTSSTTGLALSITIDRCTVVANASGIAFILATTNSGAADWDALCVVRNTLMVTPEASGVIVTATSTNTFKGGGIRAYNCTLVANIGFRTGTASQLSTSVPCNVYNSVIYASTGLNAATAGQIVENYNTIYASTARTNVTAGGNSKADGSYAPLVELGQHWKWGFHTYRQIFAPDGSGSPLLGFGSNGTGGNYPTVDWQNRPRPSGGASESYAVGAHEFHDFQIQDISTYYDAPSSAKLIGPGDAEFFIPVDAVATTLAIWVEQGTGYGGTNYVTATLLGSGEIGVATQTETCTSTTGSFQQLTFSPFTPTAAGFVILRITSFDTVGNTPVWFDALTGS